MFGFKTTNGRIQELEREVRALKNDKKDLQYEIDAKQEEIDRFDRERELADRRHNDEIEDIVHDYQRRLRNRVDDIDERDRACEALQNRINSLNDLVDTAAALEAREIDLEARAAIVEASELTAKKFKEQLDAERNKTKQTFEQRYAVGFEEGKAIGFAEGQISGINVANQLTQEDRTNVVEIAKSAVEASKKPSEANVTVHNSNKES